MRVVRLASRFANFIVVLAVAAGGSQRCPLESAVWVPSAARDAIIAQPRASRDGGRSQCATAWKSSFARRGGRRVRPILPFLPAKVILPSLSRSTASRRKIVPFRTSAVTSSHADRGPPVDL